MTVFEMAERYYPRLWSMARLEVLVKAGRLTEEEKAEQETLRREYIEAVRRNLRGTLNSISIKEKDGSITDLGKKYGNVGHTES